MVFVSILAAFSKNFASPSEGVAEGGCGGNSATPERSAGAKRRRSFGILFKMSSDFFQQTPPKFIYSVICLARGFAPRFGRHFGKIIPGIFEINRQFSRRKAAVHPANAGYCGFAAMSRWFSFAFGEIQNEILINCWCKTLPFYKIKNF